MLVRVEGCNVAYLTIFYLDFCVSIFRHMTHGPWYSHLSPVSVRERKVGAQPWWSLMLHKGRTWGVKSGRGRAPDAACVF